MVAVVHLQGGRVFRAVAGVGAFGDRREVVARLADVGLFVPAVHVGIGGGLGHRRPDGRRARRCRYDVAAGRGRFGCHGPDGGAAGMWTSSCFGGAGGGATTDAGGGSILSPIGGSGAGGAGGGSAGMWTALSCASPFSGGAWSFFSGWSPFLCSVSAGGGNGGASSGVGAAAAQPGRAAADRAAPAAQAARAASAGLEASEEYSPSRRRPLSSASCPGPGVPAPCAVVLMVFGVGRRRRIHRRQVDRRQIVGIDRRRMSGASSAPERAGAAGL